MAFLVCVGFSGYGVMRSLLYCVPVPLNAALCVLPTPAYLLVLEPRKTASVLDHRASGAAN